MPVGTPRKKFGKGREIKEIVFFGHNLSTWLLYMLLSYERLCVSNGCMFGYKDFVYMWVMFNNK